MLKKFKDYFKNSNNIRHIVDISLSIAFIAIIAVCFVNVPEEKRAVCVLILSALYVSVVILVSFLYKKISLHLSIITDDGFFLGNASRDILSKFKFPIVVFDENGNIVWHNKSLAQCVALADRKA